MRKRAGFLILIAVLSFVFFGCRKESPAPRSVVVKTEITYNRGGETLYRCYTHPDKIRQVLMCLRLQELRGSAKVDPERIVGDRCKILLTYCDGSSSVILEKANRFRSRDYRQWEEIEKDENLYPLLLAMPGDVSQTWAWINSGLRCPAAV